TATVAGFGSSAASDICRRSSDTDANIAGNAADSADVSPGKLMLVTLTSANATDRAILSTCVTAVASTVPNVSLPAPFRKAMALRNAIALPSQVPTSGGGR